VTLRIEATSGGQTAMLRLIGRIEAEYLGELRAQVRNFRPRLVLDLNEVTLVDAAGVHLLLACEAEGIELVHCSPYIREWMDREQDTTRGGSI